jgi:hypothetical protein
MLQPVHQGEKRCFECVEPAFETQVVATILDQSAGMPDRRPVAAETCAHARQAETKGDVGEIHRHLPRQGHLLTATCRAAQRSERNAGHSGNRSFGQPRPCCGAQRGLTFSMVVHDMFLVSANAFRQRPITEIGL